MANHSLSTTKDSAQSSEVRWQVDPQWQSLLLGPSGLRLDEWLAQGQAEVLKNGQHRTVYRVDLAERSFFLKHYRCNNLLQAGRHWLRSTSARREYFKALEVARRNIPTVTPVALGEEFRGGRLHDNYLITKAIPQACPLDRYYVEFLPKLATRDATSMRRKLCLALARLCASAHQAGVMHDDLHSGNVLVRLDSCHAEPNDDRLPELFLVDLPGVQLSASLSWPRTRDNLAMLNCDWMVRAARTQRWRFWRAYLAARPDLAGLNANIAAAEIVEHTRSYARRVARGRDRRALRTNRDFQRQTSDDYLAHAVQDLDRAEFSRLVNDPEHLLLTHRHRPVKLSHTSVVVEAELTLSGQPVRVAYKRARAKNWLKALTAPWRRSRALHAWYMGHALLSRGIATARPLAVLESRRMGMRWDSYLATQWIEGAENLHLYAWDLARRTQKERRRRTRQIAENLGRLLGKLHDWQFAHRDLKGCNLVVVEHPEDVEVLVIDLDGLTLRRHLTPATQAQNLARLAVSLEAHPWLSRTDRLRFLRAYLRQLPRGTVEWKSLWRDIADASRRIILRLEKKECPLV